MDKKIVLLLVVLLIVIVGCNSNVCGNDICEWNGDYKETSSSCSRDCVNCDDNDVCTGDSYDYSTEGCVYEKLENCCGNNLCETGEDPLNCDEDCYAEINHGQIEVRANRYGDEDRKYERIKYVEGEIHKLDELYAGTNVGEMYTFITNTGTVDIKNLYATYTCDDPTYTRHSSNVCYVIPGKMESSVCSHFFSGSDEKVVFKGDKVTSEIVSHFPVGSGIAFGFHISPLSELEHFRGDPDQDMFHELSCKIDLLSDESNLKETIELNNYHLRGDLSRFRS